MSSKKVFAGVGNNKNQWEIGSDVQEVLEKDDWLDNHEHNIKVNFQIMKHFVDLRYL